MFTISGFIANLNINIGRRIKDRDIVFSSSDEEVAWKIYVELTTRITLQPLGEEEGDEEAALSSLYSFFTETRNLIREGGPEAKEAARLGIFVLNEVMRPFMAKWHKVSKENNFDDENKKQFRKELRVLQKTLKGYADSLLELLKIEDGLLL